jgi:hypothetical protein
VCCEGMGLDGKCRLEVGLSVLRWVRCETKMLEPYISSSKNFSLEASPCLYCKTEKLHSPMTLAKSLLLPPTIGPNEKAIQRCVENASLNPSLNLRFFFVFEDDQRLRIDVKHV